MEKTKINKEKIKKKKKKKNIHFIVHNQPIEKRKIIIHRTPSRNTRFLKLEKELKEAFKENES